MADSPMSRRAALRLAAAAPLAVAAGCRGEAVAPPGLLVELSALPEGERVRVVRDEEPIELVRRGGEVTARSLWCTHVGCEVRWVERHGFYACPCHGGTFDAEGRPTGGPPNRPLRAIAVTRHRDAVVVPPRDPHELGPRRGAPLTGQIA
jgi:cytochrome b6-f complex iron-sulfur subunit